MFSPSSFFLKYKQVKSKAEAKEVSYAHMKAVTSFFTANFVENIDAYRFVVCELQEEVEEKRTVAVQTPMLPLPLSMGEPM
jgi:hypothetical protein